MLNQTNYKEFG